MRKYTIRDLNRDFPDDDSCLTWLLESHWPDGAVCSGCERVTKHHRVARRMAFACDRCGTHIYPMAGTVLERSSTPLRLWFYAIYLMAQTRCGISAKQLERELGVTYKTAWRMFKQIRSMLGEEFTDLFGRVEVDETYVGGPRRGKRGREAAGKSIIAGVVERGGRVVTKKVPDVTSDTLTSLVKKRVDASASMLYADELPSYNRLYRHEGYIGKRVYHKDGSYTRFPNVHTNSIEGFWSLVKGGITGVYRGVSGGYVESYFNEYAYRYSHRNDEAPMFLLFLWRLVSVASAKAASPAEGQ